MMKILPKVMGVPAVDYMKELELRYKDIATPAHARIVDFCRTLSETINPDVCLSRQQRGLVNNFLHGDSKDYEDTGDVMDMIRRTGEVAAIINSFRLDCSNCLNEKCRMRDPEKPFEK